MRLGRSKDLRKLPACPECGEGFPFLRSLGRANFWLYECPNCQQRILSSGPWRFSNVVNLTIVVLLTLFAIYQEEQGVWERADGLLFLATYVLGSMPILYILWLRVEFGRVKKDTTKG